MASSIPKEPMLVIVGATGNGKSKLAVELATRFNGEIINGDAIQMYKGLPIITNKIPDEERHGIPHHLLDFIGLEEEPWTVTHFVDEAQKVVKEIRSRGKLPILVGGTHYYTQSLLLKDSLIKGRGNSNDTTGEQTTTEWPLLSAPTEQLYAKLQELDPIIAKRWHPKDRRHIRRCLQICLQTGRKASDVYQQQQAQKGSSAHEVGDVESKPDYFPEQTEHLRYATVTFWLHAQDEVLKARLNCRVDDMLDRGLLEEAADMSQYHLERTSKGSTLNLDKGIWISIGFKEVQPYIAALRNGNVSHEKLTRIREECIDAVKASTRQYAKRQNRWIRLTLTDLLAKASSLDMMFLMDCTELRRWTESVSEPSLRIADAFLKGGCLPEPSSLSSLAQSVLLSSSNGSGKPQYLARRCSVCDKVMMSETEWTNHLKSSGHKKVIEGQRRRIENERRRQSAHAIGSSEVVREVPFHSNEAFPL